MKWVWFLFSVILLISLIPKNTGQASVKYYSANKTWLLEQENKQLKEEIARLQMLNVKRWNFNYTSGTLIDGFAFSKNYYCVWANGNDFNKQTWLMIHEYYHTKGYKHGEKMDEVVESKWENISQCLN